jgi:hypothetical protein
MQPLLSRLESALRQLAAPALLAAKRGDVKYDRLKRTAAGMRTFVHENTHCRNLWAMKQTRLIQSRVRGDAKSTTTIGAMQPSAKLLSGALAGLLSMSVSACGDDDKGTEDNASLDDDAGARPSRGTKGAAGKSAEPIDAGAPKEDDQPAKAKDAGPTQESEPEKKPATEAAPPDAGKPEPKLLSAEAIPFADFNKKCDELGGVIQQHSTCAGSNSCKGLSYNSGSLELTEHSCKGLNTCGGLSCVVLPKDSGITAEKSYEDSCEGCHSYMMKGKFAVYVAPGTNVAQAKADFLAKTVQTDETIVTFGRQGIHDDGVAYSNMPGFFEKYSVNEIKRLVEFTRKLEPVVKVYDIYGTTTDADAGM